jgi:membrane fusion protein (multidrug efflux system)
MPESSAEETPAPTQRKSGNLKLIAAAVVLVIVAAVAVPIILRSFNTLSTDDAYVNGYVTFVAPRVSGQVLKVRVDDNNRVHAGDVLVELDPEPYQKQVYLKQAALDSAQADLVATMAAIRGQIAQARSQRFALTRAIEDVDNQVALLQERVAKYQQAKASLALAQTEYDRGVTLVQTHALSSEDLDQRKANLNVAQAQVTQALEDVYQARAQLGLVGPVPVEDDLGKVPPDIDQTYSAVRKAQADLLQSAAQFGVFPSSYNLTPQETVAEFYRRDPEGNIDRIYAKVAEDAPSLKQARATVAKAQRDLELAQLDLSYCTVTAAIDGVITRRNVNPGNNVQVGQTLMALRSLTDIWVDANFKETQIGQLRIGQKVNLVTDAFGAHHAFEGRISGFTMGTGSTLALLPAQNATGNFVKVVQRLPVRIDLVHYNPEETPLFIGLSVTPTVDLTSTPEGPNAGHFLQEVEPRADAPAPADPPAKPAPAP